jgi:Protein of unknown function (DUF1203)
MPTTTLRFIPLPALVPDVASLPAGAVRRVVADRPHSFPCRRCLRDAEPGEALLLLPYDPFLGTSPYRQPGPVYLHEASCAPDAADLVATPAQLTRRRLSVRAYDAGHLMVAAEVVDGAQFADAAGRLLADPRAAYLHVHNAAPGCFAVRVERG